MRRLTLRYDPEHQLDIELYLPDTAPESVIIYFHGGGLERGTRLTNEQLFLDMAQDGYAVASADYRLYPQAKYPDFIQDAARAVAYMLQDSGYSFDRVFVGGSSAGSYLAMMLLFDPSYLAEYGLDPLSFDGWVLDAGQPTVHFNVLRERGLDTRLVRVDETSAFWHINHDFAATRPDGKLPMLLNFTSTYDMTCRTEQLKLLHATLLHFGWPADRLKFIFMEGYRHCEYAHVPVFTEILRHLMDGEYAKILPLYSKPNGGIV